MCAHSPNHSQEWSMSNFPCSFIKNITSHSMENLIYNSLLRWRYFTTNSHCLTYTFLFRKVRRMYFLNMEVKGLKAHATHYLAVDPSYSIWSHSNVPRQICSASIRATDMIFPHLSVLHKPPLWAKASRWTLWAENGWIWREVGRPRSSSWQYCYQCFRWISAEGYIPNTPSLRHHTTLPTWLAYRKKNIAIATASLKKAEQQKKAEAVSYREYLDVSILCVSAPWKVVHRQNNSILFGPISVRWLTVPLCS